MHKAIRSVSVLNYCFHWGEETEEWLLLRCDAFGEKPQVIAEYPRDEDTYQMFHRAVLIVRADIAGCANRIGHDSDPSVCRHGL